MPFSIPKRKKLTVALYRFNYHKKSKNDITVIYKHVSDADEEFKGCMTLNMDSSNRVLNIGTNIGVFPSANISMETYIMKRTDFIKCIYKIASLGTHSYFEDYIKSELPNIQVGGFEFKNYLKCINLGQWLKVQMKF